MTNTPSTGREAPSTTREALLKAATTTFLRSGYDTASLERIADEAGVARRTVYNQFASKETLFRAVLDELGQTLSLPAGNDAPIENPRQGLAALAHDVLHSLTTITDVAFMRMTITQNPGLQKAVKHFYTDTHGRTIDAIVSYLRRLQGNDILRVDDLNLAAHQFVGLFSEELVWSRVVDGRRRATRAHTELTIHAAVNIFLSVYSELRMFADGKSVSRLSNPVVADQKSARRGGESVPSEI